MIQRKLILVLDLSEDKQVYDWLKSLMQNPIYPDETTEEEINRYKVFDALSDTTIETSLRKTIWDPNDDPF